jgi:hypothetical protein
MCAITKFIIIIIIIIIIISNLCIYIKQTGVRIGCYGLGKGTH